MFLNRDAFRFNLPFIVAIGILVISYLPLISVVVYRKFGVRPNPRIGGPCIVLGSIVVAYIASSRWLELTIINSALFGAVYILLVLYPARAIARCMLERRDCDWVDLNSLQRLGYSVEYSFPEPTRRAFWVSIITLQSSLCALLIAFSFLVNSRSLWLQILLWIIIAAAFIFIRLYTSNSIGRPICSTYISSSITLLMFFALLILDYTGYVEGLVIPRGLELKNIVYPALIVTAINMIAFVVDAYTTRGGAKRFGGLGLCIGQTPVVRIKDKE